MYGERKKKVLFLSFFTFIFYFLSVRNQLFSAQKSYHSADQSLIVQDQKQPLSFSAGNTDLFLSGQIQEGFFYGKNLRRLTKEVPDVQSRFRHRMHVGFLLQHYDAHGSKKDPIIEAAIKLHNMQWWQDEYSNLLIKYYRLTSKIPQFSFSDAWIKISSTALNRSWDKHLHVLKVGYFPYQLGRGVSLGFADEGGIKYLGFEISYDPIESAYYSPGILLQGWIHKKMRYELYASLLHSEYEQFFLQKEVKQPRLFAARLDKDQFNKYGTFLNRWVASEKLIFFDDDTPIQWRAEQYLMYGNFEYSVDDNQLPFIDRAIHGGTYGLMLDCSYKQWKLNVEAAGQYGGLKFFTIDNNDQLFQIDSTGKIGMFYDNAGIQSIHDGPFELDPFAMPVAAPLTAALNRSGDFDVNKKIITDDQKRVLYSSLDNAFHTDDEITDQLDAFDTEASEAAAVLRKDLLNNLYYPVKNSSAIGSAQWRPEKNLNLQGCMVMLDLSYQCKSLPCTVHWAGGYLSGDQAPLIKGDTTIADQDQYAYKGFLPMRDHRYRGLGVKSFSFFTMRVIERPAGNNVHFNDISNLVFAGMGVDCLPKEQFKNTAWNSNLVFFFQPKDQYMFDSDGVKTDQKAAWFAAVEWNASMQYRFLPQCELLVRGAVFLPQRLYRDMKYQQMSCRTIDGKAENVQRAGDVAYALHVRMTYDF
jgi:hypothetical protein